MFELKKLINNLFSFIGKKATKKSHTSGLVITTALVITILTIGVNGFGSSLSLPQHKSTTVYESEEDDDEDLSVEATSVESIDDQLTSIILNKQIAVKQLSTDFVGQAKEEFEMYTFSGDQVGTTVYTAKKDLRVSDKTITGNLQKEDVLDKVLVGISESENGEKNHKLDEESENALEVASDNAVLLSEKDFTALLKIVEAEATGEDIIGKILVANVVINRVESKRFPNSIYNVVHQKIKGRAQFSPIDDGRYYSVKVTDTTREAVNRALEGENYAKGALFFVARSLASDKAVSWFDRNLKKVEQHGCHEFYKYY